MPSKPVDGEARFGTAVTGCAPQFPAVLAASVDEKTTVPLGATGPGLPETTRAVKVTSWLTTAPLAVGKLEDRLTVVGVAPTVKGDETTVDPVKLLSPET